MSHHHVFTWTLIIFFSGVTNSGVLTVQEVEVSTLSCGTLGNTHLPRLLCGGSASLEWSRLIPARVDVAAEQDVNILDFFFLVKSLVWGHTVTHSLPNLFLLSGLRGIMPSQSSFVLSCSIHAKSRILKQEGSPQGGKG